MRHSTTTAIILLQFAISALAQESEPRPRGSIVGSVQDATLKSPIEFVNIILFNQADSVQIGGTTSGENGAFQMKGIAPGTYYLEVRFMGYEMQRADDLVVADAELNVGTIRLKQTPINMEDVTITGERPALTYEIDRKVINVSQQQTAISGTAVDVLENAPSVRVDIEGNVSLRGSSNFTVLIDGRPTVLEPNDALQQIPASSIETIEIITNPSAKHDPEGAAGIINVVMKKRQSGGRSGLVDLNAGLNDKYGSGLLFEFRREKYNASLGLDYNQRYFNGEDLERNETRLQEITSYIHSNGDSRRGRISKSVRGGLELKLSPRNTLAVGGRFGSSSGKNSAELSYEEWSETVTQRLNYFSLNQRERSRGYLSLNTSFRHNFLREGHEFNAEVSFSGRDGDEETRNELHSLAGTISDGKITTEKGPDNEWRARMDYSRPLGAKSKLEAGYHNELERSKDITGLHEYNVSLGEYELMSRFANATTYDHSTHALYTLYSDEKGQLGFQGGIRSEYTLRTIRLANTKDRFTIDRWDYFPTAHLSYRFPAQRQIMASYTRRIDRPGGSELEPFETWTDAYNVRIGNPAIKPEYIDSYEMGYQLAFGKSLFSTEVYYRLVHNKIERVRSVYAENVTLHSAQNIGTDYAFGSELLLDVGLTRIWEINLLGNLYQYRIEGVLNDSPFSKESFNWSTRLSQTLKLGESAQIQADGIYNSATVSSQGRREGSFVTNLAIKQEFFNAQLSATMQLRDVFGTAKDEFISKGADFYTYRYSTRESPGVMLNVRYKLSNSTPKREREREQDRGEEDNDF